MASEDLEFSAWVICTTFIKLLRFFRFHYIEEWSGYSSKIHHFRKKATPVWWVNIHLFVELFLQLKAENTLIRALFDWELTQQISTFIHVSYEISSCWRELLKQRVSVTVKGHVLDAFSGSAGDRPQWRTDIRQRKLLRLTMSRWSTKVRMEWRFSESRKWKLLGQFDKPSTVSEWLNQHGRTWSLCIRSGPYPTLVWTQWSPGPRTALHSHFDRLLRAKT